jgi:hypothetical protein
VVEPLPRIGFLHTPSLTRFSLNRKPSDFLGQFVVRCRVKKEWS